jgi:GH35 family endo-1,4-beta-xylanase
MIVAHFIAVVQTMLNGRTRHGLLFGLLLGGSALGQNLVQNPGFEAGTTGWFDWGPVTLTASTAQPHSGLRSASVENRTETWHGVAQSLLGDLQPTRTYRLSAWVRLANGADEPIRLTMQKVDDGGTDYQWVATGTAQSSGWTQLLGGYTLVVDGTLSNLNLYVEGPAAGIDFYVDDFVVEEDDWKAEANARIEQIRKRDVRLVITDVTGNPMPGAGLAIRQTNHRFGFGSAINGNISNPDYAAFFRNNFEWAVMENESKWYANEPTQGNVSYAVADSISKFCRTNGITLRGHTIFWSVETHVQDWVKNLNQADLRVALTNRLNSAVGHFKDTFVHWDVNNEMLHGDYFESRLGTWVRPWMFQQARAIDPDVKLFVNEYNVITSSDTDAYKQQIADLLAAGAPIGGVGAQGHFGATVNVPLTEARIDSLAELGLPIWITEYDSVNADESVRAENVEALYRLAFSKESVDGVLMWGFWAGSHWRGEDAALGLDTEHGGTAIPIAAVRMDDWHQRNEQCRRGVRVPRLPWPVRCGADAAGRPIDPASFHIGTRSRTLGRHLGCPFGRPTTRAARYRD